MVAELVAVLTPLEKMTSHFSGSEYVTLSWVYPMVLNCIRELADCKPKFQVARDAKEIIQRELLDRWYNMVGDAARVAMMMDPRFKSMRLTGEADVEEHFTRLRTLYMRERQLMPQSQVAANAANSEGDKGFFHPSLCAAPQHKIDDDEFLRYRREPEIDIFIKDPKDQNKMIPNDPLEWWARKQGDFETFARIARRYLAIPASSVPSESMFSTAGRLANKGDAALNANLLINRNWKFVMSVDPADYEPSNRDAVCHLLVCVDRLFVIFVSSCFFNPISVRLQPIPRCVAIVDGDNDELDLQVQ